MTVTPPWSRPGVIQGGALNITIVSWLVALASLGAGTSNSVAKAVLGTNGSKHGDLRASVFIAIVAGVVLVTVADIISRGIASAANRANAQVSAIPPIRVMVGTSGSDPGPTGYAIASRTTPTGVELLISYDMSGAPPPKVPAWKPMSKLKLLTG